MSNANNMHEYEVKESIGKGAFGNAFIALHKRTGQKYVMKKVRLARQTDRQRKASHQEMKIVSALRHPYIVGYKDSWIGLLEMPGLLGATRASGSGGWQF